MGFQIKDIQQHKPIVVKRDVNNELGLIAKLEISDTPEFKVAIKKFQAQFAKMQEPTEDDFLAANNTEDSLTGEKLMLILIGEYMIKSWNAEREGEPLEPSYQNLKMMTANYERDEDMIQVVSELFTHAREMITEFNQKSADKDEAAATTKKKPLRSTAGTKKAAS
tara:strand:- start:352 stop:849 length:498 start_codon:yes stop_codon:yes gene_type:complete